MHITWHGISCIKLQTTTGSVIFNPFTDTPACTMPKLKVDIAATSDFADPQCNNLSRLQGDPFLIEHPGEYEIADIFIYGLPLGTQTGFLISAEGMTLGHPGVSIADYTSEQIEQFDGVDVLFLPLTGSTSKQHSAFVSQVNPRIIIPVYYKTAQMKKAPADWIALDGFAKEMGKKDMASEPKLIVKASKLPQEETQVSILDMV